MYGKIFIEVVNVKMIDKETLYNLYIKQNKTQQSIADELGCSRENIKYYANLYGIKKEKGLIYKNVIKKRPNPNEIIEHLKSGKTMKQLSKEYGITHNTLKTVIKENNIDTSKYRGYYLISKTNNKYDVFDDDMEFEDYRKKASQLSRSRVGHKKPKGCVVDHLYSVKDGYKNKVPLSVISNPKNLRFVTQSENLAKGANSIITLNELYKMIE